MSENNDSFICHRKGTVMKRLVIVFLTVILLSVPAYAITVTYTYSGNSLTETFGDVPTGITNISGYFTMSYLLTSANFVEVAPVYYSFTDGLHTLTSSNSSPLDFRISTDSEGYLIGNWNIWIRNPYYNAPDGYQLGTQYLYDSNHSPSDGTTFLIAYTQQWVAWIDNNPGTWTTTIIPDHETKPVPEPSSILILMFGLIAILGTKKKFQE